MSNDDRKLFARGEDVMALFTRGAEFTQEILRENERLRSEIAQLHSQQDTAAQNPEDWEKLRVELLARIDDLEQEYASVRDRLRQVEDENSQFASRYVEIEEENNNLANLYVASYQLHSTLEVQEVLNIVIEIVINLIGAETFAVYLMDEKTREISAIASEGVETSSLPSFGFGEGTIGRTVAEERIYCTDDPAGVRPGEPIVCVPLIVEGNPIGAISIYRLLQQKTGFSELDHELFQVLGGHAATAIFAARLYSQSERKLNTIQGFIDLLTD